ncbi:MAG: MFS transporter [Rhodospirillaceae bacterium]|nr:MFS transporter [Rhodospirillaceae bacterium]
MSRRPHGRRPGRGSAPPAARSGLEARQAAIDLLQAVLVANQPLDDALNQSGQLPRLAWRDRAFARMLVATALRRLGQIDTALAARLTRPLEKTPPAVLAILRIGVAQAWFLNTPAHAVVSTGVDLAGRNGAAHAAGMVNAVLRGLTDAVPTDLDSAAAARANLPDWLYQRLVETYGAATADAIVVAHLAEPPLDISVKGDPEGWAEQLDAAVLPTGTLRRVDGGAVASLPGYAEGAWWVQDAAAALPARLLGDVAGKRVVDLCAAPGGKTAQLAASGAHVTAVDQAPGRLTRLSDNLTRLSLTADLVTDDAATWRPDAPPDAVLLDPSCTSTGTIRRHPDVPHLKGPDAVDRLAARQSELLDNAVAMLAPGGLLVYCTCSLLPEEGERQIARLLERGAPMVREPVQPNEMPGLTEAITPEGDVRTLPSHWPNQGGLDGFHVSRLRRTS